MTMTQRNATGEYDAGCDDGQPPMDRERSGMRCIQRLRPQARPRTAFVFSGGGARGALQVGALRALFEYGELPDVVVGTSIGAWNAAWIARTPTCAGVEALAEAWLGLQPDQVLLGRPAPTCAPKRALKGFLLLAALRRLARGCSSLFSDDGTRRLLSRYLGEVTFDELALPLRIVAADLTHGGRAVFSHGAVVPAVLASSAIPGIFPPVRIGDVYYADGGTVDGCSIETAVELGARRIFVLANAYDTLGDGADLWRCEEYDRATSRSVAAVIQRASQVMGNYQIERALERLPHGVQAHVISLSTENGAGSLSFRDVTAWMDHAYLTTRDYLRQSQPQDAAEAATPLARSA